MLVCAAAVFVSGWQSSEVRLETSPGLATLSMRLSASPLNPPHFPPGVPEGYAFAAEGFQNGEKRFEVYAQTAERLPLCAKVCRTLLRLWSLAHEKMGLDHSRIHSYLVEVYLTESGLAGGEQKSVTQLTEGGVPRQHNCIFVYRMESFTKPMEMLREIAHEYGHAIMPPIGGFSKPEEWGNGYLGENLFVQMLCDTPDPAMAWGEDTLGVSKEMAERWRAQNGLPKSDAVWIHGADEKLLEGSGIEAMNAYIGLMLFAQEAFTSLFARMLALAGGQRASDALSGVIAAIGEQDRVVVRIPERLKGRPIWLPLRGAWDFSGAKQTARKRNWIKIAPTSNVVTLTNHHEQAGGQQPFLP